MLENDHNPHNCVESSNVPHGHPSVLLRNKKKRHAAAARVESGNNLESAF